MASDSITNHLSLTTTYLLLALVLALFAFGLAAFVFTFFGALMLALFAFSFGALVLAFFGTASMLLGGTFGLAAHGSAVTFVHAVVLALLGHGDGGVLDGLSGLVVVAGGHGKSKGHGGKSGEEYFFHFFDV